MIKIEDLYSKKENCCGCELCSQVCAHGVLTMSADKEGFLYPTITDIDSCVDCKRCIQICPLKSSKHPSHSFKKGFGGHACDEMDIKTSSSGGLSTIIGRHFIKNGGIVYGVRYSESFSSAMYARATSEEELELFKTSKYFQARKESIYNEVKADLIDSKEVLFVGLSCEIAALYNYLGRDYDNLFTVSLICHGVTSPRVQEQFCSWLEGKSNSTIKSFSVRHKIKGWKPYYIKAVFSNGEEYVKPFVSTDYEMAFKYLKRPSCSHCKFKLLNKEFGLQADMIIGDFHGQKSSDCFYNKWGASQFYVCTLKGEELLKALDGFMYSEVSVKGKEWSSPVLSVPTKKLLLHSLYSFLFQKYGLAKASNTALMRFAYRFILPREKKFHSYVRGIQIRLFHKVFIW